MRMLVVGDVGWQSFYHLGDEAMTEMALDELLRRGVDLTLVAGDPDHASARYRVPAVPRLGFRSASHRDFNLRRRERVLEHATGGRALPGADPARELIAAMTASDAVLIAGGGNLNSMFAQHIYERSTVTALAQHLGRPYALTSQTVGPHLTPADRPLLTELLVGARLAGAREASTAALMAELGVGPGVLAQGMDDAYGLHSSAADHAAVADLVSERYVVASFAERPSTPRITHQEYHRHVATALAEIAERLECRVLLVPHAGNPQTEPGHGADAPEGAAGTGEPSRDQVSDGHLVRLAGHDRVRATRMLTAKQLIALTEKATLVVGSRYHAAIFGARAGVPTLSLAPNRYSSVRMRGAATNVGLQDFVLDLDSWMHGDAVPAAEELVQRRDEVGEHLAAVRAIRAPELTSWWDGLVETLGRRTAPASGPPVRFAPVPRLHRRSGTPWATTALLQATERDDAVRQQAEWRQGALERDLAAATTELDRARSRSVNEPPVGWDRARRLLVRGARRRLCRIRRRLRRQPDRRADELTGGLTAG